MTPPLPEGARLALLHWPLGNSRPLSPEDAAPRPIPWDMMGLPLQAFRFVSLPFAIFSAPGFSVNFRPLSICHQHTACCPALALWVLGQRDMARAAAELCEAGQ